jgi:hypothetical protein
MRRLQSPLTAMGLAQLGHLLMRVRNIEHYMREMYSGVKQDVRRGPPEDGDAHLKSQEHHDGQLDERPG